MTEFWSTGCPTKHRHQTWIAAFTCGRILKKAASDVVVFSISDQKEHSERWQLVPRENVEGRSYPGWVRSRSIMKTLRSYYQAGGQTGALAKNATTITTQNRKRRCAPD